MTRVPLRIAVLEADQPLEGTAARYGSYGGVFSSLLAGGIEELSTPRVPVGELLKITKWDVQISELYPSLDDIDAILITGSRANAFDNAPWIIKLVEFTRKILQEQSRIRVIGVCFGHQIVGRALGARVDRNECGWEASVTPIPLSQKGKRLFGGKDVLNLHQMHRDILIELPVGTKNLGSTDACQIQGIYAPRRLITVQGHPEFTNEIVREILETRKKAGIFTEKMFREMISRVDNKHDGLIVAKAFLEFLME